MRGIMVGASSQLYLLVLRKQLRIMAKRNQAMRSMGKLIHQSSLQKMVERKMDYLGWTIREGKWVHTHCPSGFRLEDILDDSIWEKVSHSLRESFRELCFHKLKQCGRHDAQRIGEQPYSPLRRKLAIKWAGANFTAFMLACGGIPSPLQRASKGKNPVTQWCPVCREESPEWDHLWKCFTGSIPDDGLLRRFLWPQSRRQFSLRNAFLSGMQALRQ